MLVPTSPCILPFAHPPSSEAEGGVKQRTFKRPADLDSECERAKEWSQPLGQAEQQAPEGATAAESPLGGSEEQK